MVCLIGKSRHTRTDVIRVDTCNIDGCDGKIKGRNMCGKHYTRFMKYGDVNHVTDRKGEKRGPRHKDLTAMLASRSTLEGDCVIWGGSKNGSGYGKLLATYEGEQHTYAHRLSYRIHHGEIPEGMHIDHICHEKSCINPDHLRLASNKQNHENLKGARSDSKSGIRGAIWSSREGKYIATVWHDGKRHVGGYFMNPEDAGRVAAEMRASLFTHDRG